MSLSQFVDLVKLALPEDVRFNELLMFAPQELWQERPYEAVCMALKECPRFNWDAYLVRNADVKQAGVDPCQHYIRHGIYEGRKLVSWHSLKESESPGAPLVSIVLINYNNAHLLSKCLDSVISQTLKDIEIIVVDDCSTDESLSIIEEYAARDKRIKVLVNEKNSATLITRKRGVMAATGRYLMFLDSDDYMATNACDIATKEISKGYDMVKFGAYVFNSMCVPEHYIKECVEWCNRGTNKEYVYGEIVGVIFNERKLNWLLWSNIYLREIVVAAFEELPDKYFTGPDDALQVLAITRRSRSLLKIEDKLIYYNFGPGVSLTNDKDKIIKYLSARCNTVKYFNEYIDKYSINVKFEKLYLDLCNDIISKIMPLAADNDVAIHFGTVIDVLGFQYVLKVLMQRYGGQDEKIAALIRPLPPNSRKIKHIGVFYPVLGPGGVEVVIRSICRLLENDNYRITIFTEEKSENDLEFPSYVDIVYITPIFRGGQNMLERMQGFESVIAGSGIDVMLHAGTWRTHILWDMVVLHQYAIPVIFLYHFNFAWTLTGECEHNLYFQDLVFRCAEAVTCLSPMEELYLRKRGVNAIYMPNPIKQFPYEFREQIPTKIAVIGRFGSWIKQVGQSLKVLQEIVSRAPWISMYLIGDFYTNEQRDIYHEKVNEYGLEKNIILTGWTDDPNYFLKQCGVLLSTSYWEAFPLGIAEAQSLGLPCVIYDLTIEQARDNPAIIKVAQGDYKAAADKIIALFENPEKWHKLSILAVENTKKYTPERFADRMRDLLANFQSSMPIGKYSYRDYEDMAKNLSFYSKYKDKNIWC